MRETYGKHIKYSVTVDYHNIEFQKYKDEIENALLEVARKEIEFYKENKQFL